MPTVLMQSDIRSNAYQQQYRLQYLGAPDGGVYADSAFPPYDAPSRQPEQSASRLGYYSESHPMQEYGNPLSTRPNHDFSSPAGGVSMLPDSELDTSFSDLGEDRDLAIALANYQPCDDCTPETKTVFPHHHHTSGRLAGASATLDGHFCCSWLVHDQPCFLCFESAEALDNHIKSDHAGKDCIYRCLWQDCSKHDNASKTTGPMNFGNKPKLMRHVHSHTGYKPFPCPYPGCDRGFVTKEQLKNHETTHTKSRKYKCDQCGRAFAVKSALTTHITAVHEEKKIHRCDICGKAFADSSNLSKHKQTHFRESGVRKQRSRRGTSNSISARSTPSISTPTAEPATPVAQVPPLNPFSAPGISPGLMAPPAAPKFAKPKIPMALALPSGAYGGMQIPSATSSPPPDSFDPNCYCCEQRCPPPNGPPTPCNETDDCDRDGFCDLPDCLARNSHGSAISSPELPISAFRGNESLMGHQQIEQLRNFQLPPQWDDMLDHDPQRSFSQFELEEQFTNMHGS